MPARIADHDALIGQIIGGAVMPICADKALHVPTIWGFFLWWFERSTEYGLETSYVSILDSVVEQRVHACERRSASQEDNCVITNIGP